MQYVIQATSIEKLQEVLPEFLSRVHDNPTFKMADVDLKFSSPEVRVNINRDKAGSMGTLSRHTLLGVQLSNIMQIYDKK